MITWDDIDFKLFGQLSPNLAGVCREECFSFRRHEFYLAAIKFGSIVLVRQVGVLLDILQGRFSDREAQSLGIPLALLQIARRVNSTLKRARKVRECSPRR